MNTDISQNHWKYTISKELGSLYFVKQKDMKGELFSDLSSLNKKDIDNKFNDLSSYVKAFISDYIEQSTKIIDDQEEVLLSIQCINEEGFCKHVMKYNCMANGYNFYKNISEGFAVIRNYNASTAMINGIISYAYPDDRQRDKIASIKEVSFISINDLENLKEEEIYKKIINLFGDNIKKICYSCIKDDLFFEKTFVGHDIYEVFSNPNFREKGVAYILESKFFTYKQ